MTHIDISQKQQLSMASTTDPFGNYVEEYFYTAPEFKVKITFMQQDDILSHKEVYEPYLPGLDFVVSSAVCTVNHMFSTRFEISHLQTHLHYRKRGYGRLLIEYIQERCSNRNGEGGPLAINLHAKPGTEEFYMKCGFKRLDWMGRMRWQPRQALLREVMRPIRKPGIFTEGYD